MYLEFDENIHPCKGCEDFNWSDQSCKSNGGCDGGTPTPVETTIKKCKPKSSIVLWINSMGDTISISLHYNQIWTIEKLPKEHKNQKKDYYKLSYKNITFKTSHQEIIDYFEIIE